MDADSVKIIRLRAQSEQMLVNAVLMIEMAMEMKNKAHTGEKFVSSLRCTVSRSRKVIASMRSIGQGFLLLALQLSECALKHMEKSVPADQSLTKLKQQYTRLINTLRRQCSVETSESVNALANKGSNMAVVKEKIRSLEAKQQLDMRGVSQSAAGNVKPPRVEADEKYPKNFSKDSLIDLSAVVNLPTVPEDVFTTCAKPGKSASLCSVKSLRKLMMTLQRAETASGELSGSGNETVCQDHNLQFFIKIPISTRTHYSVTSAEPNKQTSTSTMPKIEPSPVDPPCSNDKEFRPTLIPARNSIILADITEESLQDWKDNDVSNEDS